MWVKPSFSDPELLQWGLDVLPDFGHLACNDIIVLRFGRLNFAESKLGFGLSKPDFLLRGPEGWELKRNCIYRHEYHIPGVRVTNVAMNNA